MLSAQGNMAVRKLQQVFEEYRMTKWVIHNIPSFAEYIFLYVSHFCIFHL
jgi:hypothetical protein